MRKFYDFEIFPSQWKKGILFEIPKKGICFEYDSCRSIRVLPAVAKTLVKVVLGNIKEHLRACLAENRLVSPLGPHVPTTLRLCGSFWNRILSLDHRSHHVAQFVHLGNMFLLMAARDSLSVY